MRSVIAYRVAFFVFLFTAASAEAQEAQDASKLNALFELLESNHKFMGTVAVSKNGKIVFQRQAGMMASGPESVINLTQRPNTESARSPGHSPR